MINRRYKYGSFNIVSKNRIEREQTTTKKKNQQLILLGLWIAIELISKLLGFVESTGGRFYLVPFCKSSIYLVSFCFLFPFMVGC